jgi:hypothetical protein
LLRGPADPDGVTDLQPVVHIEGAAAAVGIAQDARPPGCGSVGSPHSEYWRVAALPRIRSTCAPGSQCGNGWA